MTERLLRFVRAFLALALLGVGPVTRVADALIYHSRGVAPTTVAQVDDGTAALPHGDGCLLAVASAPATPPMACRATLAFAPLTERAELASAEAPAMLRATGPPPSRGPPA